MSTARTRNLAKKPFILSSHTEEILKAIHFYRYMTALDVAHLLYSPSSLTYVRSLLTSLAGGTDFKNAHTLYRFRLPISSGGSVRIFTLGSKGRDFLVNEGLPVDWLFRPNKIKHLSQGQIIHNLTLTRFLVAAHAWTAKQPNFKLSKTRICYELAREAVAKVIPDGWVEFARHDGKKYPILLEVDRGMEYSRRFMSHVRSRIEFIRSGAYRKIFGTDAVVIAYLTTGDLPEYRETRRKAMCRWTQEVLAELHIENWASIFRISSVVFDELYTTPIFDEPVWYRPDSLSPVPLFTP